MSKGNGVIERLVFIEQQCVSYKWLAYDQRISMDAAKSLLEDFVNELNRDGVQVLYLIAGHEKDAEESHCVKIVRAENLQDAKLRMDRITSEHIYSVQPAAIEDPSTALWNKNQEKVLELIQTDTPESDDFFENKFSKISLLNRGKIGQRRVVAEPQINVSSTMMSSQNAKTKTDNAYKHIEGSGQKKKTSAMDFFGKQASKSLPSKSTKSQPETSEEKAKEEDHSKLKSTIEKKEDNKTEKSKSTNVIDSEEESEDEMELDDDDNEDEKLSSTPSKSMKSTSKKQDKRKPKESATPSSQSKKLKVIDSDDEDDMQDQNIDSERVAKERQALKEEEKAEKERKKIERKEQLKKERQELKRQEEEKQKERRMKALGVVKASSSDSDKKEKKFRIVKRPKKVTQEFEEDGFLVVKEVMIEEEVEEEIPEEELKKDVKENEEKPQQTKPKSEPKQKQGKLSMFFQKKV